MKDRKQEYDEDPMENVQRDSHIKGIAELWSVTRQTGYYVSEHMNNRRRFGGKTNHADFSSLLRWRGTNAWLKDLECVLSLAPVISRFAISFPTHPYLAALASPASISLASCIAESMCGTRGRISSMSAFVKWSERLKQRVSTRLTVRDQRCLA